MVPFPEVLNDFETPIVKSMQEGGTLVALTLLLLSHTGEVCVQNWLGYFTRESLHQASCNC